MNSRGVIPRPLVKDDSLEHWLWERGDNLIVKCLPASGPPPRGAFSPGIKLTKLAVLAGRRRTSFRPDGGAKTRRIIAEFVSETYMPRTSMPVDSLGCLDVKLNAVLTSLDEVRR